MGKRGDWRGGRRGNRFEEIQVDDKRVDFEGTGKGKGVEIALRRRDRELSRPTSRGESSRQSARAVHASVSVLTILYGHTLPSIPALLRQSPSQQEAFYPATSMPTSSHKAYPERGRYQRLVFDLLDPIIVLGISQPVVLSFPVGGHMSKYMEVSRRRDLARSLPFPRAWKLG
jgi:hypothetical protein